MAAMVVTGSRDDGVVVAADAEVMVTIGNPSVNFVVFLVIQRWLAMIIFLEIPTPGTYGISGTSYCK